MRSCRFTAILLLPALALLLTGSGCASHRKLYSVFKSDTLLTRVADSAKYYHLQVVYTQIDRDKNNVPHFKTYTYNLNTKQYFYPASTVKLPYAALALEEFHAGAGLKRNCFDSLKALANGPCQTTEFADTTALNNRPSIAQYIRRMLLVSDNRAYNRIYDFVGQSQENDRLYKLGYKKTRIIQRFDPACTPENNRRFNIFIVYTNDSDWTIMFRPKAKACVNPLKHVEIGTGYYKGDSLIHQPRSFRNNNYLPLNELNRILQAVMLPEGFSPKHRFQLNDTDYHLLWKYLCMYPGESVWPRYDSTYYPLYKKYIYYGGEKDGVPDSNIRVFNIIGQAYGFTTDAAYVVDFEKHIEFMVSATLYTNADGVLNDDKYEYSTVALPFLKALGRQLYTLETQRKRRSVPDLHYLHPSVLFPAVD